MGKLHMAYAGRAEEHEVSDASCKCICVDMCRWNAVKNVKEVGLVAARYKICKGRCWAAPPLAIG